MSPVCPTCNKPLVDFDAPPPERTGTTCNPINSPGCWRVIGKSTKPDAFGRKRLIRLVAPEVGK